MKTTSPKIPATALVAIVIAGVLMLGGAVIEGAKVMGFLNPSAALIVFGGTIGATLSACGADHMLQIASAWKAALGMGRPMWEDTAVDLIKAADVVRREGMIKLEDLAKETEDPFLAKAYGLMADGNDPDVVADVLYAEAAKEHAPIKNYANLFTQAGGFSPTMGIIGTVMGLTHALSLLDTPELLGPAIASAFMATLYGVSSANVCFLPIGTRMYAWGREVEAYRDMIITALMVINRGENPRLLADHLAPLIPDGPTGDELFERWKSGGGS